MKNIIYPPKLSPTQCKVLQYLCIGKMYKEIADELGLSINTIKNHVNKIYTKLQVTNRTEACNILLKLNYESGNSII